MIGEMLGIETDELCMDLVSLSMKYHSSSSMGGVQGEFKISTEPREARATLLEEDMHMPSEFARRCIHSSRLFRKPFTKTIS